MMATPATGLEELAAELDSAKFACVLVTGEGRHPSLRVTSRRAGLLSEDIYTAHGWFWFSWAERIATVDQVKEAAAAISRILAAGQ